MIISLPFKGKVKIITGEIPDFQNIQQALINSIDASPDVQKHKTNLKCKMTDWRVHETDSNFAKICGHLKAHVEQYQKKATTKLQLQNVGAHIILKMTKQ